MQDRREIVHRQMETVDIERPFELQNSSANNGYGAYRDNQVQDNFQLITYWRIIRKRFWLVVGIAVLLTTLAAIYVARKPDIFEASGWIQVDMEQANLGLVSDDKRPQLSNQDPSYFNTQLLLLGSDSLLRRVVKELSLDSNKDFQKAKAEQNVSALGSMLKAIGLASDDSKKSADGIEDNSIISSSTLASSEEIEEAIRLAPYVKMLKDVMVIEPIRESRVTSKDTRLIQVSYRHTNRELAALVVNGLGEIFTKSNQEKRTGTSTKTNDFLKERIASLQSEIKASENKVFEFNKSSEILKTDDQQTVDLERLSGLNKQLLEAENERKIAEAKFKTVENSPERINSLVEEQMVRYFTERENNTRALNTGTQRTIAALNVDKAKLLEEYQPTAPEVKELEVQLETLKREMSGIKDDEEKDLDNFRKQARNDILNNLRTSYERAKSQEDKIRVSFDAQKNRALAQGQSGVAIRLLEQDIETKKGFLENITKSQRENDVKAIGTDNNISVAEIAIPPKNPVAPRRLTTVLGALFLSTLFGMGLAIFLDYLDDSIRTTEEIESLLQLPALAAIPKIDLVTKRRMLLAGGNDDGQDTSKSELLIHTDSRSSLAESYRQLRTSILLSTAGRAPKSLLITSSMPSEGKTTTAINTAISLAQTGAKVLIIDADMRRPRLHSVFDVSNAQGLSTLLSSELTEDEMLNVIEYNEDSRLNLLTSGPVPPNPAELIGSEQMTNLLNVLQKNFTHVVVDSPPIASFTDGVLIASMVDGVILVVNSGKSSRQVVRRSRQLLMDIGAKILGVVLNNVNLRSQENNYYYQSYYHRDNYRQDDDE
ncbi:MAG: polysaccharide biosynthesis tyrosine autokinase [Acidobacteria bacterium]|nr:polysaccharide biosynthesis tyrosine autokinase [Acidobacteriota bacterium]